MDDDERTWEALKDSPAEIIEIFYYYDGPRSGLCSYLGEFYYFDDPRYGTDWPDRFDLYNFKRVRLGFRKRHLLSPRRWARWSHYDYRPTDLIYSNIELVLPEGKSWQDLT